MIFTQTYSPVHGEILGLWDSMNWITRKVLNNIEEGKGDFNPEIEEHHLIEMVDILVSY
jgi:hypothetical protein